MASLRKHRVRHLVTALLCGLVGASCATKFESGSKISTLRILAVQKDKPYARPGETVHLSMLLDDGGILPDGGKRNDDIEIRWFGGCENPRGDAYAQCFRDVADRAESSGNFAAAFLSVFSQFGLGLEFDLTLAPDIISRRPPPANPAQPPNGTSFTLFTACVGGTVKPVADASGGIPIGCFTKSGKQLGPDAFVIGYTEVFAYEKITNANPIVTGFEIDDTENPDVGPQCIEPDCVGDACIALARAELGMPPGGTPLADAGGLPRPPGRSDAGGLPFAEAGTSGVDAASDASPSGNGRPEAGASGPSTADSGSSSQGTREGGTTGPGRNDGGSSTGSPEAGPPPKLFCETPNPDASFVDLCTTGNQDTCKKYTVKLKVDEASAEHDGAQEAIAGGQILEQMWINYYSGAGKLEHDVKLLNDATTGWNEDHYADFRTSLELGPFHVWAVAHDNRGGSQWARVTLTTRP